MSSELEEWVARAIDGDGLAQNGLEWEDCHPRWQESRRAMARAAIAAIGGFAPSKFSPGDAVEVRKQNDTIDEIIIRHGDIHIEQMSADNWFMGIDASDGSYWQFWFGSKNRKTAVLFHHTETVPK